MVMDSIQLRPIVLFLVAASLAGCAGDGTESSDVGGGVAGGDVSATDDASDAGGAFRLGIAGWENSCTVLSNDEVADATGFTVLEAREAAGCNWIIETVDEGIVAGAESSIGWTPVRSRDFDIQQETAPLMSSDTVLEPLTGLGKQAFWLGNTVNSLGAVWVQTEQIGFGVINQFASGGYQGDSRRPLEALAAALVDSLAGMDVIAASGESGQALIPPAEVDLPDGIPTMDGVLEELDAVPLPDGAVLGSGDVYPDRASQEIYLDLSVGDTARFYVDALPAAGFEIVFGGTIETEDQVLEYAAQSIAFTDLEGRRGNIQIGESAFAPTNVGIQIFLGD